MATDEQHSSNSQIPPPAVTLPPYPEMILSAIEALGEKNGSNKSSIWRQMESTYGELPPDHSTLLTHHLDLMKSTGQLLFIKNNYLKPDSNAPPPPRRGRGRPPKPKTADNIPSDVVPQPSRPRGRPPKAHDSNAVSSPPKPNATATASAPAAALSGKKRGRPAKVKPAVAEDAAVVVEAQQPAEVAAEGPKRGRGRPPKVKPAVATAAASVGA